MRVKFIILKLEFRTYAFHHCWEFRGKRKFGIEPLLLSEPTDRRGTTPSRRACGITRATQRGGRPRPTIETQDASDSFRAFPAT